MTALDRVPENRDTALEEVYGLLESRRIELWPFFEILCRADDGYLKFNVGDLTIEFMLNLGVFRRNQRSEGVTACFGDGKEPHDENMICISFHLEKGNVTKIVTYEFSAKELRTLSKRKQLKVENTGCK